MSYIMCDLLYSQCQVKDRQVNSSQDTSSQESSKLVYNSESDQSIVDKFQVYKSIVVKSE
jgi:hypothetical protein